jgi:hypothetical protein
MRLLDNIQGIMTRSGNEKKIEMNKTFMTMANSSLMKYPRPSARTESMMKYPKTKEIKILERMPKDFVSQNKLHLDSSKKLETRNSIDYSTSEFENETMTLRPKSTRRVMKIKNLHAF